MNWYLISTPCTSCRIAHISGARRSAALFYLSHRSRCFPLRSPSTSQRAMSVATRDQEYGPPGEPTLLHKCFPIPVIGIPRRATPVAGSSTSYRETGRISYQIVLLHKDNMISPLVRSFSECRRDLWIHLARKIE
jgi:hypothetical protein